jgi:hypothetical protein
VIVYQEQTDNVRRQVAQLYSPANLFFNQAVCNSTAKHAPET